jgi:hypothetical protein
MEVQTVKLTEIDGELAALCVGPARMTGRLRRRSNPAQSL